MIDGTEKAKIPSKSAILATRYNKFRCNQSVFRIIKKWSLSLSLLAVLKRWSGSIIDLLLEISFGCGVLAVNYNMTFHILRYFDKGL